MQNLPSTKYKNDIFFPGDLEYAQSNNYRRKSLLI